MDLCLSVLQDNALFVPFSPLQLMEVASLQSEHSPAEVACIYCRMQLPVNQLGDH